MSNRFYTYLYRDPTSDQVVYVGNGIKRRIKSHLRHCFDKKHPKGYYGDFYTYLRSLEESNIAQLIEVILSEVTEEEAFAKEISLIAFYGRKTNGGSLFNRTDGGDGASGFKTYVVNKKEA